MLVLLLACADPPSPCGVESTVPGFVPDCDGAVLSYLEGESRLVLVGDGGALVAFLPADIEEVEYGGTSGRYLAVTLEVGGQESAAEARTTTLTFARLDEDAAEARISADFESGTVVGPFDAAVER